MKKILLSIILVIWHMKGFHCSAQSVEKASATTTVHTWWHWADGNITKDGITKDLEAMKANGISQATIINVGFFFQKQDFGVPKVKFNSPAWLEMFSWALVEAKRLNMVIGAHQCDGWSSSGGPWISPELSMKTTTWSKSIIKGGKNVSIPLLTPYHRNNFYKDVAVVAYQTYDKPSRFQTKKPTFLLNDSIKLAGLADGSHSGGPVLKWGDNITVTLNKSIVINRIAIMTQMPFNFGNPSSIDCEFTLLASNDGKGYAKVCDFKVKGINRLREIEIPATKGRYFKIGFKTFPWHVSWHPFSIAEIELLGPGEKPFYQANIPFIQEKTISVKNEKASDFECIATIKENFVSASRVIDISSKLNKEGLLNWNAPKGNWVVIRFGYTSNGVKNAPANAEGEGLECDKMDSLAVQHHFSQFPQTLIKTANAVSDNTFKFLLIESWECGMQNWTANFAVEFQKRRGYSIVPFIPVLCGHVMQDVESSEAMLYDFRKTIAELIEQNYYEQFATLCHKNKLALHCEGIYGNEGFPPTDIIKTAKHADVPMQEFWVDNDTAFFPNYKSRKTDLLLTTSGALFYDKPILSAEAYTAMLHYSESPWDLKPFGDAAYCSGINQFVMHSYVHQPLNTGPGMTLGNYGSSFNRLNPWFNFSKSWLEYHERIQNVLQVGERHADLLYFIGDQMPQIFSAQKEGSATSKYRINIPQGYQVHACNYDILKDKISVKGGKLIYKNVSFSILVLPDDMGMELATLQRLEELVAMGVIVHGSRPTKMLGLNKNPKASQQMFDAIVSKLWSNEVESVSGSNQYKQGKVYWGIGIDRLLVDLNVPPDFVSTQIADSNAFIFTHRIDSAKDIYFVCNQENKNKSGEYVFNTKRPYITAINPVDGERLSLSGTNVGGKTRIPFTFLPKASWIFIFENTDGSKNLRPIAKRLETDIKILKSKITLTMSANMNEKMPLPMVIDKLKSLTEFDSSAIKYFSGIAHYRIEFSLNTSIKYDKMILSLGEVGATAKVVLNGQTLGQVWTPFQKFDISTCIQKENVLEVFVANEYRNRIIGDLREYGHLKNGWASVDATTILKSTSPLKPAGLLGPIKICGIETKTK